MSRVASTMTTASIGAFGPQLRTTVLRAGRAPQGAIRVEVDARKRYQSVEGFGAAMTESSAVVLQKLPAEQRSKVMRELFSVRDGLGLSYVRVPLGSSDFAESTYSYADRKGPASDPLRYFSIERDKHAVIPMLHEALRVNPDLELMVSPWAPPEWMCVRDSDGARTLSPDAYGVYAEYLVRTLDAFASLTPPIYFDALTPQNEPYHFTPDYPSMRLDAKKQTELIVSHLGPRLEAYNEAHRDRPAVKLIVHDHNWDLWPGARDVLDGVGRYADGIAYHGYGGDPLDHVQNVAPTHPTTPVYFTEVSGFYGGQSTPTQDLMWDARNLLIGPLLAGARTCLKWNIALDEKNGPLNGGAPFLRALIKVEAPDTIVANHELFSLGAASSNVRRGAVRIDVKTSSPLDCVAFENRDGSRVLLARNPTDTPLLVALESGAQASIAPQSFVAIRW